MSSAGHEHTSADRLQALLDGALPPRERARVEEHLAGCARCAEELDGWRLLFEELSALPRHAPAQGFQARVMASVALPSAAPLGERLRRRILALLPSPRPEHPGSERLQDFLDGALPAGQAGRLVAHLDACEACASEADAWRAVYARLGALPELAPRAGFADRVMAAVRLTSPAMAETESRAPAVAGLRLPDWRRALAVAGRVVPRVLPKTRRAWAALAGVAVTPAVTVGLVLYTLFSHPTLTPQALISFAIWKITELAAVTWGGLTALAFDAGQVVGVDALARSLFEAPVMLAGGALAYSFVCALALRVLYKNLWGQRRHARLSHS
jgi:anti-sigma factor RsiW